MKLRKVLRIGGALVAIAMIAAACGSSSPKASSSTAKAASTAPASSVTGTFYELYQSCPSNPFWVAVNNGGKAAAKRLGVSLKIEDPIHCKGEIPQEESLLTTIINSHPAGIALSLVSNTAFSADIQKARALHIPIIAYNSVPHDYNHTTNPVEAYVGQSNYSAGVALAKKSVKLYDLSSGKTVMIVDNCAINASCTARVTGFKSVVDPLGVKVSTVDVHTNVTASLGIIKADYEAHGRPDLVVTLGSDGLEPAVKAAKEMGYKVSQLPFVGFDFDPISLKYMKEGWYRLTVDQQPFLQGYDALVDLYTAAKFKAFPINMATGPVYVQNTKIDQQKGWLTESVVNSTGI